MLGARIDAIQPQIKDFTIYLVSPPDKKTMTAVVKHDKTSGLDRNDRQKCSHLQHTLLIRKRFNKVLSFVVMGTSDDFLHLTTKLLCACVKQ